jgi:uncharacterized protein YjbI with pentapeptide repeats
LVISGDHKCATDCTSARLDHACLLRADLSMTMLAGADLTNADVRNADLTGASLCRANLSGLDLRTAILDGTDLTEVTGINVSLLAVTNRSGLTIEGDPFGRR